MKPFAAILVSLREIPWSGRFLRLAVLLLPWQTRAFLPSPEMGGLPWEQGRWSLYASMLVIGVASACRFFEKTEKGLMGGKKWQYGAGVALFFLLLFPTLSLAATGQWLIQALFLMLFVALVYTDPDLHVSVGMWVLAALVPVALLALFQTATQFVFASKWAGLAAQDPLVRGVSVIETAGVRFLRAYGSFPHPNILGGWLAMGTLFAGRAWIRAARPGAWALFATLLATALYATYARSAWIGLAVGLFGMFLLATRRPWARVRMILFAGTCVAVFCGGFFLRPELVRTRIAGQERLETRSLNERREGIRQAILVVLPAYPWGTGLGAYRVGLERACATASCQVPAEPPHLVPLLALVELGIPRLLFVGALFGWIVWRVRRAFDGTAVVLFGGALIVLLALDHYLWSLWAGQALMAIIVLLLLKTPTTLVHGVNPIEPKNPS